MRGGIRYGAGVCGANAPHAGLACTRQDTSAAHEDGKHSNGFKGAAQGQTTWLVTDAEWDRWAWKERLWEPEHECARPDPKDAFTRAVRDEWGDVEVVWVCPECLRHWDLDRPVCGECGRPEDAWWYQQDEYHGQDVFSWAPGDGHAISAGYGPAITAAGGWCAPSETVFDL